MIQQVDSNASNAMVSMPYGPERDILKYKLSDINRRFAAVTDKSTQRKQALDSIQPLAEQYHEVLQAFRLYLDGAEDKVESLKKIPRDEESAARHKADGQVMQVWCVTYGVRRWLGVEFLCSDEGLSILIIGQYKLMKLIIIALNVSFSKFAFKLAYQLQGKKIS